MIIWQLKPFKNNLTQSRLVSTDICYQQHISSHFRYWLTELIAADENFSAFIIISCFQWKWSCLKWSSPKQSSYYVWIVECCPNFNWSLWAPFRCLIVSGMINVFLHPDGTISTSDWFVKSFIMAVVLWAPKSDWTKNKSHWEPL